jgi:hypothetical protein
VYPLGVSRRPWRRSRAQESLRLALRARHRSRRPVLPPHRERQARWRRTGRLPARRRPRRYPWRTHRAASRTRDRVRLVRLNPARRARRRSVSVGIGNENADGALFRLGFPRGIWARCIEKTEEEAIVFYGYGFVVPRRHVRRGWSLFKGLQQPGAFHPSALSRIGAYVFGLR